MAAVTSVPVDWVALKRQARVLESSIERQLQEYATIEGSQGAAARRMTGLAAGPMSLETDAAEQAIAAEASRHVDELQEIVRAMRMHPEAGGPANGRTVSRLASVVRSLSDRQRALHAGFERRRETDRLFAGKGQGGGAADAERAVLADEHGRLRNTHKELDDILAGMESTHTTLDEDNASITRSRTATERYLVKIPVVGGLIASIRDRRARSQLILASVIAAVVCFFLWFFVLRHFSSSSSESSRLAADR